MPLETGTYISDLVTTNPTGTDTLDKADDHLRLIKATVKNTFPNVSGAVTPTHTELNYVDGVTSAIQTQLDGKAGLASPAFTGTPTAPTAAVDTNTTQLATTAYVVGQGYSKLASPTFTGTPSGPTAAVDTNTTQLATTAYVIGQGYLKSSTASATYATTSSLSSYATITYVNSQVSGVVSATTTNVLNATAGLSVGAVGSYGFLARATPAGANTDAGATVAGSSLRFSNGAGGVVGSAPAGTWLQLGWVGTTAANNSTLWVRIS